MHQKIIRTWIKLYKSILAGGSFDLPTSGLWAQHASAAPSCCNCSSANAHWFCKNSSTHYAPLLRHFNSVTIELRILLRMKQFKISAFGALKPSVIEAPNCNSNCFSKNRTYNGKTCNRCE